MDKMKDSATRTAKIFLWIFSGLACITVIPAFIFYLNWSAERDALAFCSGIAKGSDIYEAISKAEKNGVKHHYWFAEKKGYSFVFHGFVMGKAYCNVLLTSTGKVESKMTKFQDD